MRQTYANPREKSRIVQSATRVLEESEFEKDSDAQQRFDEALAALRREEERVFVAVLLGGSRDIVYWNWLYGYTVVSRKLEKGSNRARFNFNADLGQRRVAAPELARARYGTLVTDVSKSNER